MSKIKEISTRLTAMQVEADTQGIPVSPTECARLCAEFAAEVVALLDAGHLIPADPVEPAPVA